MEAMYRILFSGKLMPGHEMKDVAARLAKKFQMQDETAQELILNGGGRVLKRNLNAAAAERYRAALTAAGLVITIEPQPEPLLQEAESFLSPYPMSTPAETLSPGGSPATQKSSRSGEPKDGWSRCPKCGAFEVSDLTGVCQACGVVAERYLARLDPGKAEQMRPEPNPYAPPRADLQPPPNDLDDAALDQPRNLPAGRGWAWITEAWVLFKDAPGSWIGALLLFYVILIVASLIPLVGGLASSLLGPMFSAGLMLGAHAQFRGDGFTVSYLFAGVTRKGGPLLLVGLAYLGGVILMGLILAALFAGFLASSGLEMNADGLDPSQLENAAVLQTVVLPVLVVMLLAIPLAMAMFFAPALVALNDVPVLRAFKLSFLACLKNILPFLVFGLAAMLMVLVGALPFGLGLLVVMPILTIAVYTAYRDIFYI